MAEPVKCGNIKSLIHQYFVENPNVPVSRETLINVCGNARGIDPKAPSVVNSINALQDEGVPIMTIVRANTWKYVPEVDDEVTHPRKLFELVHETKLGIMILEDEDGDLLAVQRTTL